MYKIVEGIIAALGVLALLLLLIASMAHSSGALGLGPAFTLLRWGAYLGIASVALVVFYVLWKRPRGIRLGVLFVSGLLGLTAFYLPYRQQQMAAEVPPIHDISTDTQNPPAFEAIVPLRADAPNPPEYGGEEVARQQREAYPDLMPMHYAQAPAAVFAAAEEAAGEMGWEIIAADAEEGRMEAVATTPWFGFKDDVVVRITEGPAGESAIVDVRSKSRVGRSDIGANARRIREFRELLNGKLQG